MKTQKNLVICFLLLCILFPMKAQKADVVVNVDLGKDTICRHIYGHFAEHLGYGIYGGLWVGEDSPIPNTNGVRNDVIQALKHIQIPNLRWPGGCFADEYHWMDGIGNRNQRPKMVNTHWGGVTEDNSFGTHEFLDLCEVLGTEPYVCGNVGSGSVEEMAKWVEYINFDGESPMANLRRENGRDKAWNVKLWGVGNENWGCGGNMTPAAYAEHYRRYSTYCRDYGTNKLYRIAGGANVDDYEWTETLMKNIPNRMMNGLSLHYYIHTNGWMDKGSALVFDDNDYMNSLVRTIYMDDLITHHGNIMDVYDPEKRISIVVDEWGVWYNVEPGTNPGFLFQQNTMRDALIAGLTLNIFHKHCDRVKIANIAQMVNVLQAIILTDGDKMILTPTYHVFDMYKVHQDAVMLPLEVTSPLYSRGDDAIVRISDKVRKAGELQAISATASKDKSGAVHVTFVNVDPANDIDINCSLRGMASGSVKSGQILTAKNLREHNTFEKPANVQLADFKGAKYKNGDLSLKVPAGSLVTIKIQ